MSEADHQYFIEPPSLQNAVDIFSGKWISAFPQGSAVKSGGTIPLYEDSRIMWLLERIGPAIADMSVAELGPLEGGHSYMLHQAGAKRIVAIEGNSLGFLKCLVAKEVFNLVRLELICGEIEGWLNEQTARFDLLVASGILYHLKDPLMALNRMAALSDRIYLWTHYIHEQYMPKSDPRQGQFTGLVTQREVAGVTCDYFEHSYFGAETEQTFTGGVDRTSVWLDHHSIVYALQSWGFQMEEISPEVDHPNGPASCFYAWR